MNECVKLTCSRFRLDDTLIGLVCYFGVVASTSSESPCVSFRTSESSVSILQYVHEARSRRDGKRQRQHSSWTC